VEPRPVFGLKHTTSQLSRFGEPQPTSPPRPAGAGTLRVVRAAPAGRRDRTSFTSSPSRRFAPSPGASPSSRREQGSPPFATPRALSGHPLPPAPPPLPGAGCSTGRLPETHRGGRYLAGDTLSRGWATTSTGQRQPDGDHTMVPALSSSTGRAVPRRQTRNREEMAMHHACTRSPHVALNIPEQHRAARARWHHLETHLKAFSVWWWEPGQARSPPEGTHWEL